jgi:phosphatidylglycerol:prolipoprotein diacylglycerol transferase
MAGCCYGAETDSWCGIYHVALDAKVIPMQLFEAIFLFTLSITLAILAYKRIPGTMSIYMFTYGIWRFVAEYFRDDYRGSTFVDFLTPSQLTALILFIGSGIIFFYTWQMNKRNKVEYETK